MKSKTPSARRFYKQGKTKVYLTPANDVVAVRYGKSKEKVRAALAELGPVKEVEAQKLFILELPSQKERQAALQQLQPLIDRGLIESVVPVMRDKESQLLQVLTDEITVRFKRPLPKKEREQVEKKFGFTIARQNEFVPNQFIVKVSTSAGVDPLQVANELDAADEVEFAAPNFVSEHRR